jgi:uncharacterized membrane protein YgcG
LVTKHVVFASLMVSLSEMPAYLGRAQAVDTNTGEIAKLRENWLFDQTQCDLLFKGRVSEVAWFGEFGALGLMNLDAAEPFLGCPAEQLYVVESVLEQMIPFVRSTMIAAGWAAESASGYTLVALFERQLLHVKWVRKQGELELTTMLADAQTSFVEALGACDASHLRMLNHPEPAEARLSFHLPFDGPYDRQRKQKVAGVEPIINIRRAFPNLLPKSTPRSLTGVQLPTAAAEKGDGGGGGKGGGKGGGGGGGGAGGGGAGGGGGGQDKVKDPGSLKDVVSWPDATHMRLGSMIYDTAAIATLYSLDADHCFPVLLSTKKGGHALALCAHWGEPGHTALTSAKHVPPKDFNYNHVCRHCAVKAPNGPGGGKGSGAGQKRKKPGK